jgi:hypothetical protein
MRFPRTEKIEQLFLAWVQLGLEHSTFSQLFRILFLEQDLITCQPSAVIRVFHDNMPRKQKKTQRIYIRLRSHLHHNRMTHADDGTTIGDSENLLLDKAESSIVGRTLEQLGDSLAHIGLMICGE